MRNALLTAVILLAAYLYYLTHPAPVPPMRIEATHFARQTPQAERPATQSNPGDSAATLQTQPTPQPKVVFERDEKKPALPYKLEDGLMIVQGDTVVGVPSHDGVPPSGLVELQPLKLWPNGLIPFHIQPDVINPDRVLQAVALFDNTAIHLVPYTNEDDALVFEVGAANCKSYVGKMGGKQPVFIAPDCSPADIAHEILHALGFVHEQNRVDRDQFLDVHFENIDEQFKDNFEKLPPDYMKVSGLSDFDYQSLMIYPAWMFAKNGQSTMDPKSKDKLIQPGAHLSALDTERLNRAYGSH